MSNVRKEERFHTTTLECIIKARSLCKHTLTITRNNNVFKFAPNGEDDDKNPPQPELVAKIRDTAMDIYLSSQCANKTYLTKVNYKHRRALQDKSISKCNELLALIELSKFMFHIDNKKIEYWGNLTIDTRNLLQKWKEADYSRYKGM